MNTALKNLCDAIRKHEAPKGYGQIFSGAKRVDRNTDVSRMRLNDVLEFQRQMILNGSASSACGGYQFLLKTLDATMRQMGLSGEEIWTPDLQDRMAVHLMNGRGLQKYLDGQISATDFANNLSMEWASLPVVRSSDSVGSSFYRKDVGRSFYAGDGLNKSFHKPEFIIALVQALRVPDIGPAAAPAAPAVPPAAAPVKPRGLLLALIELILAIFKRRT